MAENETTLQERLNKINAELLNPDRSAYEKRRLSEEATKLIARGIVARQVANAPKQRTVKI